MIVSYVYMYVNIYNILSNSPSFDIMGIEFYKNIIMIHLAVPEIGTYRIPKNHHAKWENGD